jgi:hypothetical protein
LAVVFAIVEMVTCIAPRAIARSQGVSRVAACGLWAGCLVFSAAAAQNFVLIALGDGTAARRDAVTPRIAEALASLADARHQRDIECGRRGGWCKQSIITVETAEVRVERERQLVASAADPQASALGLSSAALAAIKGWAIVAVMALGPGLLIGLGSRP